MVTFLLRASPSAPPTRPVLSRYTWKLHESINARKRLPCCSCRSGKKGLVPGTRRNLPSSSLPPALVPCVSPSMKYRAACSRVRRATAGMMFSLRLRMSRWSTALTSRASRCQPSACMRKTARPFTARGRHHLAPRVQRQPTEVVGELVPHAQPTLLRLAEVVAVEHTRHASVEVDSDDAVTRVARRGEIRCVDDGEPRFETGTG